MALNFLVTGVKILAKKMSKKKMKEGAKKFVGGKEEKRAKVEKIMEKGGSYSAPKEKVSPTKLLNMPEVPDVKPATGNKIDFKLLGDRLDNIVGMTDALGFLTKTQADQKKEEIKLLQLKNAKEVKKKREAKLEKKDSLLGKASKGVKKATKGPLDFMQNFLVKMALGALAVFLIANAKKIKNIFKTIGENLNLFSKLLRITIFELRNGFKASRQAFKLMGKGIAKILKPIAKPFKILGSKIKGIFVGIGTKIFTAMQKVIASLPGAKQVGNLLKLGQKGASAAQSGITATKTAIQGAKTAITKSFNKVTGNVLRRGVGKAPSRLILKFFGKKGAKLVAKSGKLFKFLGKAAKGIKIPILGPIIVAVTSILSGDPIGKTLFKALGAALGGAIGVAGGPLGMIVGEILGEFLGSFLFEVFNGDPSGVKGKALLKKKFDQLVSGAGKYGKMFLDFLVAQVGKLGNFFKEGFGRFVKDFPTINIPEGGGVQTTLGKVANLLGLSKESKYMEDGRLVKVPNLALLTPMGMPFLLPHLKNSFFPSKDEKEAVPKDKKLANVEETDEKTSAVMATEDNSVAHTISANQETFDGKGGSTYAELGEKDTSSVASTTSAVSTQASYEEIASGTVILESPKRSDFASGSGGDAQFQRAMMLHQDQKAMLNSYFKTQVKTNLYKI